MYRPLYPIPASCDIFAVLPPSERNEVIFGKNADRPVHEVLEVVLIKDRPREAMLKCTHITITESTEPINAVILNKPAWTWGAEMGANDKGVAIGCEPIPTRHNTNDGDASQKRLIGMDFVRLALERGKTAEEALDVITKLLEEYGQGGPTSEIDDGQYYHISFLIADPKEVWILETSGKIWVAQKFTTGYRNITNCVTISTEIHKHCEDLQARAIALGLWHGKGEFNFRVAFESPRRYRDNYRLDGGSFLLLNATEKGNFGVEEMFKILRNEATKICRIYPDLTPTMGSQVSSLSNDGLSVHWFTATPYPCFSYYKPFVFTPNAEISPYTKSPNEPGREHALYKAHERFGQIGMTCDKTKLLREIEHGYVQEISEYIAKHKANQLNLEELDSLMKTCVETEMHLYSEIN